MSNYRAGDMIRLTRIANEMSQEELSEGICSVQTLHRIENGRTRVKKELYYKLMKKMNRIPEKNYAVCVGRDMELLKERFLFEDSMSDYNYEEAERYLKAMEKYADDNVITAQYLKKARALLSYHQKKTDEDGLLRELEESLSLTVPDYRQKLEKDFPFTEQELMHLMSIANVYAKMEKMDNSIFIYEKIIGCLKMEYIFGSNTRHMELIFKRNLGHSYIKMKEYDKALHLFLECMELAKENNEGIMIIVILSDIGWAIADQKETGDIREENISLAKKYIEQSYFLARAKQKHALAQKLMDHYDSEFGEKMVLF